jgi:hypothetical protein
MTMDRRLDEVLKEIGNEHRAMTAPPNVEAVLRAAANQRVEAPSIRSLRPAWAWGFALVLLAAIAWSGTAWTIRRSHDLSEHQAEQVVPRSVQAPRGSSESSPSTLRIETGQDAHAASLRLQSRSAHPAAFHTASPKQIKGNSLQEFIPLPVSEGLPPAAQLSVVRVKLMGSDLQQYGLQAPQDAEARTLLAEFVVGEDGLPRAIRIVQ